MRAALHGHHFAADLDFHDFRQEQSNVFSFKKVNSTIPLKFSIIGLGRKSSKFTSYELFLNNFLIIFFDQLFDQLFVQLLWSTFWSTFWVPAEGTGVVLQKTFSKIIWMLFYKIEMVWIFLIIVIGESFVFSIKSKWSGFSL